MFEHGPFDYETQNQSVEQKIEKAMSDFDYALSGYSLDLTQGRVFYFYHDCTRFWKYVRPVKKHKKPSSDRFSKQADVALNNATSACLYLK